MNNPVTTVSREVVCKDDKCSQHIVLTVSRKQKSKTATCPKKHKHTYNLKTDSIKRSRSINVSSTNVDSNTMTVILVVIAFLLGLTFGRWPMVLFLNWVMPVEVWAGVVILWVLAWGALFGYIMYSIRNRTT